MSDYIYRDNCITLHGPLVIARVAELYPELLQCVQSCPGNELALDLAHVTQIDSAGVAMIDMLVEAAHARGVALGFHEAEPFIQHALTTFSLKDVAPPVAQAKASSFERMGASAIEYAREFVQLLTLLADSIYYAALGLIHRKGQRKGEFLNQSMLIGMNAFPIVALIAFLIGFILALQSAAQLRQFGASIYVADLIAISMTREMGPLITAIIFAGRSGSAIASEIATMVVTEETDALKSMGLNPVGYVLVPKIYAITIMMPLLTILSVIIGILGAMVIGYTYLDIGANAFYQEVMTVLLLRDILTGLVKSIVFAWIIVIIGAFYGLRVRGGAEGVGKATTASVVASIFLVILADSILGLIFYFGRGLEY
jgi:phospholipid/cholesterol/gamma-HCH transport system permease protein